VESHRPLQLAAAGRSFAASRLWRDLGYAIGALAAGILADRLGMPAAIAVVAGLTVASGLAAAVRLPETHPTISGLSPLARVAREPLANSQR
jgi:hypothetical protein